MMYKSDRPCRGDGDGKERGRGEEGRRKGRVY